MLPGLTARINGPRPFVAAVTYIGAGREKQCVEHVAVFLADLSGGGAERAMLDLAIGFAKRGLRVDLLLASATGPYVVDIPPNVHLVDLDVGRVSRAIAPLASYLRRVRPDVLFTTLPHSSLAASIARLLARTRTTLFLREATTVSARPIPSRALRRRAQLLALRWAYGHADGVVAVSEGVANDLHVTFGVKRRKVWTLYSPVVTDEVVDLSMLDPEHPWFVDNAPPVVLGVGRLRDHKGFLTLMHAFAQVRATRSIRLVLLGEGEQRAVLERRAHELGVAEDVALPGFVRNPFAFMARAGVYVLSSEFEGLPGTLIQAMACGCPVVATDCRSGPREILQDGRFGALVRVGDVNAMAEAIASVLSAPPPPDHARERALRFSSDRVVSAHIAAFEDTVRRKWSPTTDDAGHTSVGP